MKNTSAEDNNNEIENDDSQDQEERIKAKIEELRKFSCPEATDSQLRQGALLALGLK